MICEICRECVNGLIDHKPLKSISHIRDGADENEGYKKCSQSPKKSGFLLRHKSVLSTIRRIAATHWKRYSKKRFSNYATAGYPLCRAGSVVGFLSLKITLPTP